MTTTLCVPDCAPPRPQDYVRSRDHGWDSLCAAMAREAVVRLTPRGVLRIRLGDEHHLYHLLRYLPEPVRAEADRILRERHQRGRDRLVAETARSGGSQAGVRRIDVLRCNASRLRADRAAARAQEMRGWLVAGKLGVIAMRRELSAGGEAFRPLLGSVGSAADQLVRATVRAVGQIGDQARADLTAMRTDETFAGKRGRNHRLERTTVESIEVLPGCRAALITLRDYRSFGSARWGGDERSYGSRGGSSYRVYLVVRDATRGTAHILRVPPKYGNADTAFHRGFASRALEAARKPHWRRAKREGRQYLCDWERAESEVRAQSAAVRARIRAAIAWTFARSPEDYAPQVEA